MTIENDNMKAGLGGAAYAQIGTVWSDEVASGEESGANLTITETYADIGLGGMKVGAEVERSLRRDDELGRHIDRCFDFPAPSMPDFGIMETIL